MCPQPEGIYDFVAIGELADTTKQYFYLNLAYNVHAKERATGLEHVEQLILSQTRDYLGRVREGFVLSVRTADVATQEELSFLIERVVMDWENLSQELGLETDEVSAAPQDCGETHTEGCRVEHVRDQLLAFGMAGIALGMLPRLPNEEVTFPQSRRKPATYADIPVPATPAAMLNRIEEIEQIVWQLASWDLADLLERRYAPLRRTYGFFESSAWLTRRESTRFGIKKQGPRFAL